VTFNHDILVLANPEIAQLPGWVLALIAAGGLAAALSTAAGLAARDLVGDQPRPHQVGSSRTSRRRASCCAARVSMGVAIVLATWLGLNPPGFAAQVVALAFGLAAASLFPVIMMGIFSKKMNSTGAIAGMLVGLISTVLYIFTYLGWFFIPGTNMLPRTCRQLAVRDLAAVLRCGRCAAQLRGGLRRRRGPAEVTMTRAATNRPLPIGVPRRIAGAGPFLSGSPQ
jgi:cation/acetate symporter